MVRVRSRARIVALVRLVRFVKTVTVGILALRPALLVNSAITEFARPLVILPVLMGRSAKAASVCLVPGASQVALVVRIRTVIATATVFVTAVILAAVVVLRMTASVAMTARKIASRNVRIRLARRKTIP